MELPRNLEYVPENISGYYRHKKGRGFVYSDEHGDKISRTSIIDRIKKLVIPPMWSNVWISPKENAHLQATGYDSKGRKQYLYHPLWMKSRNESKFLKLSEFAHSLPKIRETVTGDLRRKGWPKQKALALVVQVLDLTHIRIGNKTYQESNQTYGLTTLRRKHLSFHGHGISFEYKAKSGKYRKIDIANQRLAKLIKSYQHFLAMNYSNIWTRMISGITYSHKM